MTRAAPVGPQARLSKAHALGWRPLELPVMAALALVIALLGPFGTWALPLPVRLAQWLAYGIAGYACFRPVVAAADALAGASGLPIAVARALACLLAALPTTLAVDWIGAGFAWERLTLSGLARLYPLVLLVGVVTLVVQLLVARARQGAEAAEGSAVDAPVAALPDPPAGEVVVASSFLDQLPPHLGRALYLLENEDHYVRVYTPHGDALVLARMRDAVAGLAGLDGARVHRGWWVAREAVAGVVRRDRNVILRLKDGREVPVARANVAELRARGWF